MSTEQAELVGVKGTLLYTLYFRALDHRSGAPIVGDPWAADVLRRIDADVRKARLGASGRFTPLLRARRLDDWTREFLAGHPDATVLHLGCGLDSRAFRLDPPAGVRWFDLDFPEVIELRRRAYPDRDGYQMIGSSVTDEGWLDAIPGDRPVLVVAEGLLMYLSEPELRQLLGRLTGHFPSGELAFDAVSPLGARLFKLFRWTLGDPHELERWNARLRLVEQVPVVADYDRIPLRRYRVCFRLMHRVPALRNYLRLLRYRFGRDGG